MTIIQLNAPVRIAIFIWGAFDGLCVSLTGWLEKFFTGMAGIKIGGN